MRCSMLARLALNVALLLLIPQSFTGSQNKSRKMVIDPSEAERSPEVVNGLKEGCRHVEKFFGKAFPDSVNVQICPNRDAFDEYMGKRWGMPKTEKWMVAMGVADKLLVLSPRIWKTEAVEHNPDDAGHVRGILRHELVHVYHGQLCPSHDFEGMDDLGWFVEGLATYASGQLEKEHSRDAANAISSGKAPTSLKDAWSGPYKYGVCGSMVNFIDRRFGRQTLIKLLKVTKPDDALHTLDLTESEFISRWRVWVSSQK